MEARLPDAQFIETISEPKPGHRLTTAPDSNSTRQQVTFIVAKHPTFTPSPFVTLINIPAACKKHFFCAATQFPKVTNQDRRQTPRENPIHNN